MELQILLYWVFFTTDTIVGYYAIAEKSCENNHFIICTIYQTIYPHSVSIVKNRKMKQTIFLKGV